MRKLVAILTDIAAIGGTVGLCIYIASIAAIDLFPKVLSIGLLTILCIAFVILSPYIFRK